MFCHRLKNVDLFVLKTTKTNYVSKRLYFQKKLNDTITTCNFYLKFKERNENVFFGLLFLIPANGRAKSTQQLISTVLALHPLYFPRVHFNPNWGMLFVAYPCINSVIDVNWNFQGDHQN